MENFAPLLFYFIVIIPSAIFHEYAHGWMAHRLGDKTAEYAGRLTLDPRPHIDPWGTIFMPLLLFFFTGGRFLFAYAKPVPFNPYNLKDQRWGPVWVALAGPASNLLIASVVGLIMQLLPVSPMTVFLWIIVYANVLLAVFNLVPIPPLDGSKLLFAIFPSVQKTYYDLVAKYGVIATFGLVLVFVIFGFQLIIPVITWLTSLLTGGMTFL